MEVSLALEDDLFFAGLSRQISLLIMDDDEDRVASCPSVSFQAFSGPNYRAAQSSFMYQQNCRRGTGVFIPKSCQPSRKNRQGRYVSFNSKLTSHRQQDNNARVISQVLRWEGSSKDRIFREWKSVV